jgi:O-antigen chain-terminating methyltransferase
VDVRGIDANQAMVEECRSRGVPAEHADALAHLTRQPDGSLGGIAAIQVVEHLDPRYLAGCLEASYRSLRTGGTLLLETINPACWAAFFDSYIRDLTHRQPLHPDTLKYLVQAAGFTRVDVRYLSPVDDQDRLQEVRIDLATTKSSQAIADLAEAVNTNAGKLNRQLFSYRDYAIVATK